MEKSQWFAEVVAAIGVVASASQVADSDHARNNSRMTGRI